MNIKKYALLVGIIICFYRYTDAATNAIQGHRPSGKAIDWSILICTLEERKAWFEPLYNKILQQIKEVGLNDHIEVLYFLDNREASIGHKRNALFDAARGEYVNFLDDDDDIHANYIAMLYECMRKKPDVVKLMGIITFHGKSPRLFVHSIQYKTYFEHNGIYFRPPNHLNPMKRSLAMKFRFPEQGPRGNFGEDFDWSMEIAKAGLLKTEEAVDEPYYFYRYGETFDEPVAPSKVSPPKARRTGR